MVVATFDLWSSCAVAAAIIPLVFFTDSTFSVIVTFIFLKPILKLLQAARGTVQTAAKRRLERTARWNFAGLILTVVSSAVAYLHLIAFFVFFVFHQYSLRSVLGNPVVVVMPIAFMLNTLGMILLCGMFKDTMLPSTVLPSRFALSSMIQVGPSAAGEQKKVLGIVIDSHAYSEQAAISEESS
jgi:hypothetical protein